ncbi:hypothetical protein PIROE2DRAFT_13369 [Piromyces sp. E2]|nr:hypothetical protein PIROE2DRAFT_13369 [Piromyces sp. E2]|eukprot:OUM60779.1 hypothetical protein PIROE2DRAFT_13369 [Piromyces sp. E2]
MENLHNEYIYVNVALIISNSLVFRLVSKIIDITIINFIIILSCITRSTNCII